MPINPGYQFMNAAGSLEDKNKFLDFLARDAQAKGMGANYVGDIRNTQEMMNVLGQQNRPQRATPPIPPPLSSSEVNAVRGARRLPFQELPQPEETGVEIPEVQSFEPETRTSPAQGMQGIGQWDEIPMSEPQTRILPPEAQQETRILPPMGEAPGADTTLAKKAQAMGMDPRQLLVALAELSADVGNLKGQPMKSTARSFYEMQKRYEPKEQAIKPVDPLEQQYKMAQIEGLAAQTQTNQARTELQQQAIQSRRESERERIQAAKELQAQRLQQQAAARRESERERIQAAKDLQAQRLQQQAALREAKSRSVGERTQIKNDPSASVVGFEKVTDTGARPLEIEKFRNSATSFKSLIDDIDKYKDMIKRYGPFENPYSTAGAEMQAVARRIQLTAKNSDFFALGVLTGPDLELLESIIPTSSKVSNIFKSSEAAVAQINSFKESLDKKLNDKAASLGFRRSKPLEETTIPQTQTGPRGLSVWKP